MRLFAGLGLTVAVAICLTTCHPAQTVAPPAGGPSGTLRIPLDTDIPTMDPAHVTDVVSAAVCRQVFDALVRFDKDIKTVPDIAEKWDVAPDKKTLTFHLRKGVKFHNGREVKAADFVYSFTRILDPGSRSERASLLFLVEGAQDFNNGKAKAVSGLSAPDDYTFVVKLVKPYGPFLSQMGMINFAAVPKEEVERWPHPEDFSVHPVGTGPFSFKEWKHDDHIALDANPAYFGGAPHIAGIVYRIIPDRMTQLNEYKAGTLDLSNIPTGHFKEIRGDETLSRELHSAPLMAIQYLVMNLDKAPWKDVVFQNQKALRQALNFAIDRDYLCDQVLEGRYQPFIGIIPPGLKEWTNPENRLRPAYDFDPTKAEKLLDEGNHPQGLWLPRITFTFNPQGDNPTIAQQIQGMLRDMSINVDLQAMDWATYLTAMDSGALLFHREGWLADFPDPDNFLYTLFHSTNVGPLGNHSHFRNKEFDKIIDEARVEFDFNKRRNLYWQAEKIVLDECPVVFLATQTSNILVKPDVHGLTFSAMDLDATLPNNDLSKCWISQPAEGAAKRNAW
jgi:peptide/nickel transport system substrate-binding protein/oligopeptide transport system substrate-binding protein